MKRTTIAGLLVALMLSGLTLSATAQDNAEQESPPPAESQTGTDPAPEPGGEEGTDETSGPPEGAEQEQGEGSDFKQRAREATEKTKELAGDAADKAAELAVKIDENETAQEAAAGILQPIYIAAETLAFPAFYWLAFALMAAGVVNFAFQLVLGKLVVLSKGSINLKEILSDAISLIISVIGLVLTTQAATENSTFTQSAALVLSSALVGAVLGLFLYRWGQAQEVHAVEGQRSRRAKK